MAPPSAVVAPSELGRRLVEVSACVDAERPPGAKAGTYVGALLVTAPTARGVQTTSIPVSVTVRDDRKWLAMTFALIGLLCGLVIRSWADLQQAPGKAGATRTSAYVYSLRFLVMVVGGLLGGIGAYSELYGDQATTDLTTSTLLTLAIAAFTATLAAKSLADLVPPTTGERAAGVAGKPD
jgi:hypothetical protein